MRRRGEVGVNRVMEFLGFARLVKEGTNRALELLGFAGMMKALAGL